MKKIIKQYFTYLLALCVALFSSPIGVFAKSLIVGVNVAGVPTIEYVATINAPIFINLLQSNSGSSYITVDNNSNVYLKATLTDIQAIGDNVPNNFVAVSDKNWRTLTPEETKQYIAFELTGASATGKSYNELNPNGEVLVSNTFKETIYPADTENYEGVYLGVLSGDSCEDCGIPADYTYEYSYKADKKVFELSATVGYNWVENVDLVYAITIVTEASGTEAETYAFNDSENGVYTAALSDVIYNLNGAITNYNVNLLLSNGMVLKSTEFGVGEENEMDPRVTIEFGEFGEKFELAFNKESLANGYQASFEKIYEDMINAPGVSSDELFTEGEKIYIPYIIRIEIPTEGNSYVSEGGSQQPANVYEYSSVIEAIASNN